MTKIKIKRPKSKGNEDLNEGPKNKIREFLELYKKLGFTCIPIPKGTKGETLSKIGFKWKQFQTKKPDEFCYNRWFHKYYDGNIAIVCGPSSGKLVVLDLDVPRLETIFNMEELKKHTLVTKTGSGKYHIYFRIMEGDFINKKIMYKLDTEDDKERHKELISLRYLGQYVIAPPSIHPSGGKYEIISSSDSIFEFLEANLIIDDIIPKVYDFAEKNKLFITTSDSREKRVKSDKSQLIDEETKKDPKIKSILQDENIRPCIRRYIRLMKSLKDHHSHNINLAIGSELIANNYDQQAFINVFKQGTINFKESITIYQYKKLIETRGNEYRYKPHKCITLESYGICVKEDCHIFLEKQDIENIPLASIEAESDFINYLSEEHLITSYIDLASERTDAYPEYHFCCILSALSLISDRKFFINLIPEERDVNLWFILIGLSSIARKSTAINILRKKILSSFINIAPNEFTPEALIPKLAEDGTMLFCYPEFGRFLGSLSRSYMKGFQETLSELYDCPPFYDRSLKKENYHIDKPFPVLLAGIQPRVILDYITEKEIRSGFLIRPLIAFPTRFKDWKKTRPLRKDEIYGMNQIEKQFIELSEEIKKIKKQIPVELTVEALNLYNDWCKHWNNLIQRNPDDIKLSLFTRIEQNCLKIAFCLLMGDPEFKDFISLYNKVFYYKENQNIRQDRVKLDQKTNISNNGGLLVNKDYMEIAIRYSEDLFLDSAYRFIRVIEEAQTTNIITKIYNIVLNNQGIDRSSLMRKTGCLKKDFQDCIDTLISSSKLKITEIKSGKKTKKMFYALDPDKEAKNGDNDRSEKKTKFNS